MAKRLLPILDDRHLVEVCEQFLRGDKTQDIANWVTEHSPHALTREQVYALINEARNRKLFAIRAPWKTELNQRIADLYRQDVSRINVVNAGGPGALDHVASRTADLALEIILKLAKQKERVHIGLGAGVTTMTIARHLAALLRAERGLPPLRFHALSSGFHPEEPRTAPVAFFGFFDDIGVETDYVGLFAPSVVESNEYGLVKQQRGVLESFAAKKDIDIVITALGSWKDRHSELNRFLKKSPKDIARLKKQHWVGDVQYRPFSARGPLSSEASVRAVTLYELDDLVQLANTKAQDKYVIVSSGPCAGCSRLRTDALRPLLLEPSLKVWTDLVMDVETAQELVAREGAGS